MKLTIGQAHDAVTALAALEDPEIKLSGETILAMAININLLRGIATAYEHTRARVLADTIKESGANNQEMEATFLERDASLRNAEVEADLRPVALKDLDLANNPKIRPVTMARLMPILTGV